MLLESSEEDSDEDSDDDSDDDSSSSEETSPEKSDNEDEYKVNKQLSFMYLCPRCQSQHQSHIWRMNSMFEVNCNGK